MDLATLLPIYVNFCGTHVEFWINDLLRGVGNTIGKVIEVDQGYKNQSFSFSH
jgi:hypothetical protein